MSENTNEVSKAASEEPPPVEIQENTSKLYTLLLILFLNYLPLAILNPVQVELFELINKVSSGHHKHSTSLYGALFSWPGFIFFIVSPIIGSLSDRFGRKIFIVLHSVLTFTLFSVYLLACYSVTTTDESEVMKFFRTHSFKLFVLGKTVQGFCLDFLPLVYSYISDHAKKENLSTYFSYVLASAGLSTAVGPILSGYLAKNFGLMGVFIVTFSISLLVVIFIVVFLEGDRKSHVDAKEETVIQKIVVPFKSLYALLTQENKVVPVLIVSKFASALLSVGFFCIITQYTRIRFNFGVQENGYLLTIIGICAIISNTLLSKPFNMITKGDESMTCLISGIGTIIMFLLMTFAQDGNQLLYCATVFLIGAKEDPARTGLISKNADGQQGSGLLQGALGSVSTLARIIAPIIFSSLLELSTTPGQDGKPFFLELPIIAFVLLQSFSVICIYWASRKQKVE